MSSANEPVSSPPWPHVQDHAGAGAITENWLPAVLSVIAGMVDVIGFLTLGNVFTAHITGNLVVASAHLVRGGHVNPVQILAIPAFMVAVAGAWWFARAASHTGANVRRRLLLVQCILIGLCLAFSVTTRASLHPHGLAAGIAIVIAVSAMASQFTLLRLTLPRAPSTAVMTGNLTNTVLALMERWSHSALEDQRADQKLRRSLRALIGFLVGCVLGALAVSLMRDWAWSAPFAVAAAAVVLS